MVVILGLFLLYFAILPNLVRSVSAPVLAWLPVATINECLMWAIMALGLNVVVGYAGLLDLGYVAFWALGGYTAGWLMAFPFNWTWDFHLLSPVRSRPCRVRTSTSGWSASSPAVLCAIFGIIIGAPTLRLRGDYLALVTLGFGEVITQFFRNSNDIGGLNIANGDPGISPIDPIGTGPIGAAGIAPPLLTNSAAGNVWKILVLGFLVAICIFVSLRIREGRLGRAWLAIREDELAASMMGVPLVNVKLLAYAVGAFFGGVGGVANASAITTAVSPSGFDFGKSVLVLLMVVLGGMGNVWGVTIGAFLLAWLNSDGLKQIGVQIDQIFGTSIAEVLPRYNYIILGLLLVLMMLFRREGLFPEQRTKALLQTPSRTEAESLGADSLEAEAETEAVQHASPEEDARMAAAAVSMSPVDDPPVHEPPARREDGS